MILRTGNKQIDEDLTSQSYFDIRTNTIKTTSNITYFGVNFSNKYQETGNMDASSERKEKRWGCVENLQVEINFKRTFQA